MKLNNKVMKRIALLLCLLWIGKVSVAQPQKVSDAEMERIYQEVKTPYKYGLVLTPQQKGDLMDCPSVYRIGKKWYMSYLVFDGGGYETWLAESTDLLNWTTLGKQMSKENSDKWDSKQRAGHNALIGTKCGGRSEADTSVGEYWMSDFGGASVGYEPEPLAIGMAYTAEKPSKPMEWERLDNPVLTSEDEGVRWWENRHKLFKSYVVEDKKRNTGHRFIMYYN